MILLKEKLNHLERFLFVLCDDGIEREYLDTRFYQKMRLENK
jgi:hypothetical protein